jgi:hypothetical protein
MLAGHFASLRWMYGSWWLHGQEQGWAHGEKSALAREAELPLTLADLNHCAATVKRLIELGDRSPNSTNDIPFTTVEIAMRAPDAEARAEVLDIVRRKQLTQRQTREIVKWVNSGHADAIDDVKLRVFVRGRAEAEQGKPPSPGWVVESPPEPEPASVEPDHLNVESEPSPAEPRITVQPGDVWLLGPHELHCGDESGALIIEMWQSETGQPARRASD